MESLWARLICTIAVFFRKVGRRSNLSNDGLSRLIYLRQFVLRFFFGHKFGHLFGCVIGMLNEYERPSRWELRRPHRIPCVGVPKIARDFSELVSS